MRKRNRFLILAGWAAALGAGGAAAQDTRYLAAVCANCHGTDGRAVPGSGMPSLAGLSRERFVELMTGFRSGARPATLMHQLSKGFTDEQIAALGDYFSTQRKD